ncbi:MAG: hypothetical protein AB7P34_02970 [Vicinamibacterales bacterium]
MEFSVVQSPPGEGRSMAGAVVWRTCLREIAFVADDCALPEASAALQDEAAYAHLLEVICGLASPIVGETEVMSQFKAFVAGLPAEHAGLRQISERLLIDARAVRARHLTGLGSRSYGSAVRRHTRDCDRVAMIGTGMLAKEILPFLPAPGRSVDLWGRRSSLDWEAAAVTYRRLGDGQAEPFQGRCALVIAAPVETATAVRLQQRYATVVKAIDLRGEARLAATPSLAVVTLDDVFAELEAASQASNRQAAIAREAIRDCARAFITRAKLNPSGWHDLCA